MTILTESDLHKLMPKADAKRWAGPLGNAMSRFGLCTPERTAMFLAQVAHESAELTRTVENLNYSAEGLRKTWPSRFSPELASAYARQPERIANRAYANRMGNGEPNTGDGWRYRGRGPIQLTGKANYERAGKELGLDLVGNPDLVLAPDAGSLVAALFFAEWTPCIRHADRRDLAACTQAINGGLNGIDERGRYYRVARRVFEAKP